MEKVLQMRERAAITDFRAVLLIVATGWIKCRSRLDRWKTNCRSDEAHTHLTFLRISDHYEYEEVHLPNASGSYLERAGELPKMRHDPGKDCAKGG